MKKYHKRLKLIHGFQARKHPLYNTWSNLMARCYNENNPAYKNYGARGITVCDSWKESFESFALNMGLKPNDHCTLERVDNNLGYSPSNCVWASRTEQCLNRRKFITNTSGETGVVFNKKLKCFDARFDFGKQRYFLGYFDTFDDATEYRRKFINLFLVNRESALSMISEKIRRNSSTKIKGITKHISGDGYIIRITDNGKRKYLGFSKTLECAIDKLNNYQNGVSDGQKANIK